jgi:glycosyltransferase involved in cell wall biosynthesis
LEIVVPKDDLELAAYYRSLDILIAAGTVQHGAPHYPVLEGMASGLPVVHTGFVPGNEQNSWLARNRDCASICEQIKIIACHQNLREKLGHAVEDVRPFAWDAVGDLMINFFKKC